MQVISSNSMPDFLKTLKENYTKTFYTCNDFEFSNLY